MRKSRRAGLLAAVFGIAVLGAGASAFAEETLADAIALAYSTNPTILSQRSVTRNADEAYFRTRAGMGPTLSADLSVTGGSTTDIVNGTGTADSGRVSASASATQTLYSGGRLSANMEAQRASLLSSREGLRSIEQRVLQQVVQAYTDVRRAEQQLDIAKEQVDVLVRQKDEAQARFEVGANTITDVAQAESRLATARTQLTSAQNTLDNARAQYQTVVGKNPEDLAPEPSLNDALPTSLDEAFQTAQKNSPALRQAYLAERQTAALVSAAKAAWRPSVTVSTGPSYLNNNSSTPGSHFGSGVPALGAYNPSGGWTTTGTLSIPLYPGRTIASSVRTAEETHRQAQIEIETQLRSLNQSVTQAWSGLIAARSQIQSQQEAVRATQLASQGTREEQQVGLRTTLDLLNAEQELRQAEQGLVNAQFQEYTAATALLQAMGVLSPQTFGANVDTYDPSQHFDEINGGTAIFQPVLETLDRIGAAPIEAYKPSAGEVVPEFTAP